MPAGDWVKFEADNGSAALASASDGSLASTTQLDDGSAGDTSTWEPSSAPSAPYANVTAIWDLGASASLGRARFTYGGYNPSYDLYGSNDGSTWTSALSGPAQNPAGATTFSWASEVNVTPSTSPALSTSAYRYWRLHVVDSGNGNAAGALSALPGGSYYDANGRYLGEFEAMSGNSGDARISDFRLFDGGGSEYTASGYNSTPILSPRIARSARGGSVAFTM